MKRSLSAIICIASRFIISSHARTQYTPPNNYSTPSLTPLTCDCEVFIPIHVPIPFWSIVPPDYPIATLALTINNATNSTTSLLLPNTLIQATADKNGDVVATLAITQTTAISPQVLNTVFTTAITSPSTYAYVDAYLLLASQTPLPNHNSCNDEEIPTTLLPWSLPPISELLEPSPYTTAYPSLSSCNGLPHPISSPALIDPTQTQSPYLSDVQAQPAVVGGMTVTQLSYIFSPTTTVVPGVVLQTAVDDLNGISRSSIPISESVVGGSDVVGGADVTGVGSGGLVVTEESKVPPSSPKASVPIRTAAPDAIITLPGGNVVTPNSNPDVAVSGSTLPSQEPPSPKTLEEPNGIITLSGGNIVTANSNGEFVVSGSTYTATSGTVAIIEGGKTKSFAIASKTRTAITTEMGSCQTGGISSGAERRDVRNGMIWGIIVVVFMI